VISHPRGASYGLIGALQRAGGLASDPRRTYAEDTVKWLGWYLGPVTVTLAILGAGILVTRVWRRPDVAPLLVLAMAGVGTALYLWHPLIVPDQIWAMRRFVPAAMPLFVLLAAVCLDAAVTFVSDAGYDAHRVRAVGLAGAVGLIFFPAGVSAPVRNFEPQATSLVAVKSTCRGIGPSAAVVFVKGDVFGPHVASALRGWCDVPVAMLSRPATPERFRRLADAWQAEGRTLWVLGSSPGFVASSAPGTSPAVIAVFSGNRELEMTVARPPQQYAAGTTRLYGVRVPA
jgi:hypothetical protein